jgi:hypothetical protein
MLKIGIYELVEKQHLTCSIGRTIGLVSASHLHVIHT